MKTSNPTIGFAYDFGFERVADRVLAVDMSYADWARYTLTNGRVSVLGRKAEQPLDRARAKVASGPDVTFRLVPNLRNWKTAVFERRAVRIEIERWLEEVDLMVARLPSEIGLAAVRAARLRDVPYVVEVVGCPRQAFRYHGNLLARMSSVIMGRRMQNAVSAAPFATYVTHSYLQRLYPCQGPSVGGLSNVVLSSQDESCLRRRLQRISRWGTPQKNFRIGTVGTLRARYKGFDLAIRALSRLKKNTPGATLSIVGAGSTEHLSRLAQSLGVHESVRFEGWYSKEQLNAWLETLDIYVQPSRTEGLPRALIEAMAQGVPALGSTAGGIPELLPACATFEAGDVEKFSELLGELMRSPEKARDLASRGFETAKTYAYERLVSLRHEFYESILRISNARSTDRETQCPTERLLT